MVISTTAAQLIVAAIAEQVIIADGPVKLVRRAASHENVVTAIAYLLITIPSGLLLGVLERKVAILR